MTKRRWLIRTTPDDLIEGLFGQVILWTFELLPGLHQRGIEPVWDIRSRLYGSGPDYRVIPGVFDTASPPPAAIDRSVSMLALRTGGVSVLGNDWRAMHELWCAHFRVPDRIERRADEVGLPPGTVGVHYRGTDKNQALLDTNPVSVADLLTLLAEFLAGRPGVPALFIATDEFAFVDAARERFSGLRIVNLGPVSSHKAGTDEADRADRALLDCVLLSRCSAVLKTSSALSGFAKVLNPELACYRVAACKMFGDVPYFPDAYIPRYEGCSDTTRAILRRQFEHDWLDDPRVPPLFRQPFTSMPRYRWHQAALNRLKYLVSVALGRPRIA